jgi:hypothetical protein
MSDCGMTTDMFLVMGQRSPANISHLDSDVKPFHFFGKKIKFMWGRIGRLESTLNPANITS